VTRRKVLITGAAGKLGQILVNGLSNRYDLVLTDKRDLSPIGKYSMFKADLTNPCSAQTLCRGIDTLVHLAGDPNPQSPPKSLVRNNLIATKKIFSAAVEAGCRRIIFASSVMTLDGYSKKLEPLSADLPPQPKTFYGAVKAASESLGQKLASQYPISVICLRLGWVSKRHDRALLPNSSRLPITLLADDWLRLAIAAIEAPDDLHFGVFNGLSDNRVKRLDITETKRVLGYAPQADSFDVAKKNWSGIWRNRANRVKRWITKTTGLSKK
jgi:uronate dehydrogenase